VWWIICWGFVGHSGLSIHTWRFFLWGDAECCCLAKQQQQSMQCHVTIELGVESTYHSTETAKANAILHGRT